MSIRTELIYAIVDVLIKSPEEIFWNTTKDPEIYFKAQGNLKMDIVMGAGGEKRIFFGR